MAQRTYQRATAQPILDVMLLTYLVNLQQNVEHAQLLTAQHRAIRVKHLMSQLRHSPTQYLVNHGRLDTMLMSQPLHDLQAIGEVFRKVAALKVGYEATLHTLHRRLNTLKGLYGAQLGGQRRGISALIIIQDGGDAAFGDR